MKRDVKEIHFDAEAYRIAKCWYEKGLNEDDPVFAFVSYWIVMNQLYNFGTDTAGYDRERLRTLVKAHRNTLEILVDFDAEYLDVFMESPVLEGSRYLPDIDWNRSKKEIKQDIQEFLCDRLDNGEIIKVLNNHLVLLDEDQSELNRLMILFDYIYSVRCNLFHGHKTMHPSRDGRLIQAAAEILEICIPELGLEIFRRW